MSCRSSHAGSSPSLVTLIVAHVEPPSAERWTTHACAYAAAPYTRRVTSVAPAFTASTRDGALGVV